MPRQVMLLTPWLQGLSARIGRRLRRPGWIRIEIALLIGALFLAG